MAFCVSATCASLEIAVQHADQIDHGVHAGGQSHQCVGVVDISLDHRHAGQGTGYARGRAAGRDGNTVAGGHQFAANGEANETAAAEDEDVHDELLRRTNDQ